MTDGDVVNRPRGRRMVWGGLLLALGVVAVTAVAGREWIVETWRLHQLANADPAVREEALQELVRRQSRRAVPVLLEIVAVETTRHLPVRGPIVCAEGRASPEEWHLAVEEALEELAPFAVPEIVRRVDDSRLRARLWALHIVQSAGTAASEHVDRLIPALCDDDPLVRNEAVWAVASVASVSSEALGRLRRRVLGSAPDCELDGLVEALVRAVRLSNEPPDPCLETVERAVLALVAAAESGSDVAPRAAEALTSFVDPVRPLPPGVRSKVRRAVFSLLASPGPVRAAVVRTLASEGIVDSAVLARVRQILATASPAVRQDVAEWLGSQVSSEGSLALLVELAADEDAGVRQASAVALAETGASGREAILALPTEVQTGLAVALTRRLEDMVAMRSVEDARLATEVEFLGRLAGAERAALPLLRRLSVEAGDRVAFTALEVLDRLEADKAGE